MSEPAQIVVSSEFWKRLESHMEKEEAREAADQEKLDHDRRHWHVAKEIPIALILTIVLQTFGVIWWGATLTAKVDALKESEAIMVAKQTTVDNKQDQDARELETRLTFMFDKVDRKLDRLIESNRK